MYVEVKGNDAAAFHRALATFKSKVKKAGIFEELRKHEHYSKPSVKRKLKRDEAFKRRRREENARNKNTRDRPRRSP